MQVQPIQYVQPLQYAQYIQPIQYLQPQYCQPVQYVQPVQYALPSINTQYNFYGTQQNYGYYQVRPYWKNLKIYDFLLKYQIEFYSII